jgi:hypothetical protein
LNRENGGKGGPGSTKKERKKERKKEEKNTERKNDTQNVYLWMFYLNKS